MNITRITHGFTALARLLNTSVPLDVVEAPLTSPSLFLWTRTLCEASLPTCFYWHEIDDAGQISPRINSQQNTKRPNKLKSDLTYAFEQGDPKAIRSAFLEIFESKVFTTNKTKLLQAKNAENQALIDQFIVKGDKENLKHYFKYILSSNLLNTNEITTILSASHACKQRLSEANSDYSNKADILHLYLKLLLQNIHHMERETIIQMLSEIFRTKGASSKLLVESLKMLRETGELTYSEFYFKIINNDRVLKAIYKEDLKPPFDKCISWALIYLAMKLAPNDSVAFFVNNFKALVKFSIGLISGFTKHNVDLNQVDDATQNGITLGLYIRNQFDQNMETFANHLNNDRTHPVIRNLLGI